MTLRLILVRHGLSSFNLQKRIQGRNDLSTLTDQGILQAKQAGKELAKIPIKKVYSSPLQRAADTATTLIQERSDNPQVIFDENLLEVDLFAWSGLTIEEVKSKFPDDYLIWKNDPNELVLNNKEGKEYFPIKELMNQATKFINQLLKDDQPNKDSNILIVGHNAILRCLILKLLGEPKNGFRRLKVDNASISLVKVNKKGNETYHTQIESLNNTTHLGYPVPQKGRKARLVLVRHGETNWNKEGRFQGQIDIPLNENGKDQARKTFEYLRNISFNKAFSSSMHRPYETAQIILQNRKNRFTCRN